MQAAAGRYFDGVSAARHRVEARIEGEYLILTGETLPAPIDWPLAQLRSVSDPAEGGGLALTLLSERQDETARDAARLTLHPGPVVEVLHRHCPDLLRKDVPRGTWGRVLRLSALAVAAVVLMLFVILPRMADTLAGLIPVEREVAFGKAVTSQIERALGAADLGDLHCTDPDGLAALDQMVERLTSGRDLAYDLDIAVFDHPMMNAFAAPGGQIIVMRGLLDRAKGPDTVAAVLAHEIGHVERRDATRHALRAAGSAGLLSMVFGDISGGTAAVFLTDQLLQSSYSREAENEADLFALDMLNAAGVDSGGMAAFFEDLQSMEQGLPDVAGYFSTHPASAARAARARENAGQSGDAPPVLSDAAWQDLKGICS